MFMRVETDYICSACGKVNNTELVTRKADDIRRCLTCGHESVVATKTYTETSGARCWTTADTKKPIVF